MFSIETVLLKDGRIFLIKRIQNKKRNIQVYVIMRYDVEKLKNFFYVFGVWEIKNIESLPLTFIVLKILILRGHCPMKKVID